MVMEIKNLMRKVNSNYKTFHKMCYSSYVFHHIKSSFKSRYESDSFVGSSAQNYARNFEKSHIRQRLIISTAKPVDLH